MGHNQYRNVPCAYCGEIIAQANRPQGEAMHQRCKTLRHDPAGFVSSGARRRKRTEMVPCAWCGKLRQRRAGRKEAAVCGYQCRAAWTAYCRGSVTCRVPSRELDIYRPPLVDPLAQKPVAQANKASFRAGTCRECGSNFCESTAMGRPAVYCSQTCCRKAHRSRRRARERSAYVADVHRAYVYERDKGICHLCGKKVQMKESVPHPKAPTLDHVVPLARGGTHEPSNVRLAHFQCNAIKSDVGGGQLLLIG